MRQFLTASKDTTIYEAFPANNSGFDEILEIGKVTRTFDSWEPARALVHFDIPSTLPISASAFLHLRIAYAEHLRTTEKIEAYPVSRSWVEGTGYFYQQWVNSKDGATWRGASTSVSWSLSGSDFITGSVVSASLDTYPLQDLRIDVTSIYQSWVSGSTIPNYGFLLKLDDTTEDDVDFKSVVRVFSKQTHTIYQPMLEIAWTDQTVVTGSLTEAPSTTLEISPKNLSAEYKKGEIRKIYFNVRDKYPQRPFTTTQRYDNQYYLPTSSLYQLQDAASGLIVVPFDQYSYLNTDTSGSYIKLDTTPLSRQRFYNIKIKSVINGETLITDPFKIKIV